LLTAVQSHAIDFFLYATESQYHVLQRVPGYRVTAVPSYDYEHIAFNCRRPPLDDVRVRKALAYAIDWKEINERAYLGIDTPGMADQPPTGWAYDPTVLPYPHDIDRARALLRQAGWVPGAGGALVKAGQRFELNISTVIGNETRLKAEELVQADLAQVGVLVNVRNFPANLLFAPYGAGGVLANGRFDIGLYGWSEDPDPDDGVTVSSAAIPPGGVNYTFYGDLDIDRWLMQAKVVYDRAERVPLYRKIQRRMHDDVPFHTINWQAHIDAVNTDLQNFRPAPALADTWNAYQWQI
jgi:peptide/nickel transport system substrate-binding protein